MSRPALPTGWIHRGEDHDLAGRWGSPPVEGHGKHQRIYDVSHGHAAEQLDVWAFVTPVSGTRSFSWRTVVALDTRRELPHVRIEPQNANDHLELGLLNRLLGPARRRGVAAAEIATGPQFDAPFDRHYRIRTREVDAVRSLLTPTLRQALLSRDDAAMSFAGTDILCWRTGPRPRPLGVAEIEPLLHLATLAYQVIAA